VFWLALLLSKSVPEFFFPVFVAVKPDLFKRDGFELGQLFEDDGIIPQLEVPFRGVHEAGVFLGLEVVALLECALGSHLLIL
jgi:hypothetical protein